jgi:DNA polymerase V
LRVYIRTNPFQPDQPQYHAAQTVTLSHPSQDTRILIQAALTGLKSIYRAQFSYAKAGVHLLEISSMHRQYDRSGCHQCAIWVQ